MTSGVNPGKKNLVILRQVFPPGPPAANDGKNTASWHAFLESPSMRARPCSATCFTAVRNAPSAASFRSRESGSESPQNHTTAVPPLRSHPACYHPVRDTKNLGDFNVYNTTPPHCILKPLLARLQALALLRRAFRTPGFWGFEY